MRTLLLIGIVISSFLLSNCGAKGKSKIGKIRIIIDSDANNELDDQHAIAYALFNGDLFDIEGITVNKTQNGGDVENQKAEAVRVVKLCGLYPQIAVYKGANGSYNEIVGNIDEINFDGAEAVNFIIERANAQDDRKLVLVPIGKLTNIALAIKKDPGIIPKIKVLWLGTNFPTDIGEYNFYNDYTAVNPVLESGVEFEIAVVGNDTSTGTASVKAATSDIRKFMTGKGPQTTNTVEGRHGGNFNNFGDYSVNLFENTQDSHRSMYDMAAIAILKNPKWAIQDTIGAPKLDGKHWIKQPNNKHKIIIWDNFLQKDIMDDFYDTMKNYRLVEVN